MKINLTTKKGITVRITKEATDPLCLRASIGGRKTLGYYLTFRGDNMDEIESMLEETLEAFKKAKKQFLEQLN